MIDYDPPAVAALADGRFIIAYDMQSTGASGNDSIVQAQIYNADGSPSGGIIAGNAADPASFIASPAIVQIADGSIELVSEHSGGAGGGSDIEDQRLDLLGASGAATEQGRAVDGYIAGATVFADANGDGIHEAGEAIAHHRCARPLQFPPPRPAAHGDPERAALRCRAPEASLFADAR